jgi:hypothetical protein
MRVSHTPALIRVFSEFQLPSDMLTNEFQEGTLEFRALSNLLDHEIR